MTIQSAVLANAETATAEQYNNLRKDILDAGGHNHSDGQGGTVGHGTQSDGVIISPVNTYLNHEKLNKHVQGTGTSTDPDGPGGKQGVHGLPPSAYVAGAKVEHTIIQYGSSETSGVILIAEGYYDRYKDVSFPVAFDSAPKVYVTPTDPDAARIGATNISASGFRALIGFPFGSKAGGGVYAAPFDWAAVGVKST